MQEIGDKMTTITTVIKDKKKLIFSKTETLRLLKENKLAEVFLAANFNDIAQFQRIADINGTKINVIKQNNDELGALCRKPYAIAVIGLKK
jgi:ribosomal protein L30E